MSTITCPTCHGAGTVPDPNAAPCEAKITVGFETFECWATKPHPATVPHMVLAFPPCSECGGYDEHFMGCSVIDSNDRPEAGHGGYDEIGWGWLDGATGLANLDGYWDEWARKWFKR